jgi:hypothetical protein
MTPVRDPHNLRLALVGINEENGHPYSWSAIVNGRYRGDLIDAAGYPMITRYLARQPADALGLAGARFTHVWCADRADAERIAASAEITHVLTDPRDAIGAVDAVVIPTDASEQHLDAARPFVEAGLPVFIDKPLTVDPAHLRAFERWWQQGRPILSSSAMRYAAEFTALPRRLGEVGDLRLITVTCAKSWERYAVHALEAVYGLLRPGGWRDVINTGTPGREVVHARHDDGVDVLMIVTDDLFGGFVHVAAVGTAGRIDARFEDPFNAFRAQLAAVVAWLRTGETPFPLTQISEQMRILIAALESRRRGGQRVALSEV